MGGAQARHGAVLWWVVAALAATVLVSLGSTLLGARVFHAADLLLEYPPWDADEPVDAEATNPLLSDTVDSVLPMRAELRRHVLAGDYPLWTGLPSGGTALGAVPHVGPLSPLNLPYLLLSPQHAPAAAKLAEMVVAAGATFLFLRRVGLVQAAAAVGALAYVNSGFQVVWTNWPQSHVGALVPALFWSVERALQERRLGAFLPVTAVTAVMLLEGFPAVTLAALLLVALYAVVRLALLARHERRVGASVLVLVGLGAAVTGGLLVAAAQLLPFLAQLGDIDTAVRAEDNLGRHLPPSALATTAVPDALGSPVDRVGYGTENYVEAQSFIGVVALLLVVVALARPAPSGAAGGMRGYLIVTAAALGLVIYTGGPFLAALQLLPPFDSNFVGRLRSPLLFLLACLAAAGFQRLLEMPSAAGGRRLLSYGVGVGAAAAAAVLGARAWRAAQVADAGTYLLAQAALPAAVGALAIGGLALAAVTGRSADATRDSGAMRGGGGGGTRTRSVAVVLLPLLLAVEATAFARPFWPRIAAEDFYPVTSTHRFLAAHAGAERTVAEGLTLFPGTTTYYGLRSTTGHVFAHPDWREALLAVDPAIYDRSATFSIMGNSSDIATSPVLDRLATRYYVASPEVAILGERVAPSAADGPAALAAGVTVEVPLMAGDLRALTLTILEPFAGPGAAVVRVELSGADGRPLGGGHRRLVPGRQPGPFDVPLVEPEGSEQPVRAVVRLEAEGDPAGVRPLVVAGDATGRPLLAPVLALEDGLRTVFVDGAVIYERERALPRFRWAARAETVATADERLRRLRAGVAAQTVLLESPAPPPSGAGAVVNLRRDGPDELVVDVDAQGDGYLVVADALRDGWTATVDGDATPLLPADHALAAVHVPAGAHQVHFRYAPREWVVGLRVSALALLTLAVLSLTAAVQHRRSPGAPRTPEVREHAANGGPPGHAAGRRPAGGAAGPDQILRGAAADDG